MNAALAILTAVTLGIASWAIAFWPESLIAHIWATTDFLWVGILAGIPAGLVGWQVVETYLSEQTSRRLVGRLIAVAVLPVTFLLSVSIDGSAQLVGSDGPLLLMRTLLGLGWGLQLVGLCGLRFGQQRIAASDAQGAGEIPTQSPAWPIALLVGLLVATFVPFAYGQFLGSYYEKQFAERIGQQRLQSALNAAQLWGRITPSAMWESRPVNQIASQLRQEVQIVQTRLINSPPPRDAGQMGQLVQQLLMLDQFDNARMLLEPLLDGPRETPLAWDTLGLIEQRERNWSASAAAYQRAEQLWQQRDDDPQQTDGLASAKKGLAFAFRQTGDHYAAADAYERLIAIAPTAQHHFLAAQFYEAAQQSQRAWQHATTAGKLAPAVYGPKAKGLIEQLESAHFSCFQLFRQRS